MRNDSPSGHSEISSSHSGSARSSIAGKRLLLHSEGGLGDTLQFCRYATSAAALGATVLLEVQPPLLRLLSTLEGVSQLIAAGSPLPPFDLSLPVDESAAGVRYDSQHGSDPEEISA